MNITINSKNINPSDKLTAAIEAKMKKLDKYFASDAKAAIMLTEEKAGLAKLEATIYAGGLTFRAEEQSQDLYYCLDKVMDKLSKQMSRLKGKLLKRHKDITDVYITEIPEPETADIVEQGVVREKTLSLTAMSSDEAILQMELLEHSFFLFINPDTGKVNAVYKRKNGGYGLLKVD